MTSHTRIADGRRLRRADSRERLYDAALSLLERRRFDSLSIDEICEEANVGRATFFRIYGSKVGLLLEFNRRLALRAKTRLEREEPRTTRTRLLVIGEEIASAWSGVSREATLIATEFTRTLTLADIHKAHPDLLNLVTSTIERGILDGEIRAAFSPQFLGSMALIYMSAAATLWFEDPNQDLSVLVSEAIGNWLDGAGKGPDPSVTAARHRGKRR